MSHRRHETLKSFYNFLNFQGIFLKIEILLLLCMQILVIKGILISNKFDDFMTHSILVASPTVNQRIATLWSSLSSMDDWSNKYVQLTYVKIHEIQYIVDMCFSMVRFHCKKNVVVFFAKLYKFWRDLKFWNYHYFLWNNVDCTYLVHVQCHS